jgi:hypothetical protein
MTGCIAGALTRAEFEHALAAAGLADIEIRETHRVHEHAAAAIISARKLTERRSSQSCGARRPGTRRTPQRAGERGAAAPRRLTRRSEGFAEGRAGRLAPLFGRAKAPSWGEFGESWPFSAFSGSRRPAQKV